VASAPEILNTLLVGNVAGDGAAGGNGGVPGANGGRGGDAGGLLVDGAATITNTTIIGGNAGAGGTGGLGGAATPNGQNGANGVGSAATGTAAAHFTRSIFDGSCGGAIVDDGLNLRSAAGGCPGTLANLFLGAGAVPQPGSPAIDAAPLADCPVKDLLGTSRPQGARCDIGAVEIEAAPLTLDRSALAFAPVTLGTGSRTLTLNVRNPGAPGILVPIKVTGAPDFTLAAESCPDVLLGGANCDVIVAFTPSRAGARRGTLAVGNRTLALTGTGVAPRVVAPPQPPAAQCVVPKLKGKSVRAARRTLRRAHCTLGTITRRGRGRPGRVRSSRPKAGTVLPDGAAVDVVVNRRR
jgi:hypothetical protein